MVVSTCWGKSVPGPVRSAPGTGRRETRHRGLNVPSGRKTVDFVDFFHFRTLTPPRETVMPENLSGSPAGNYQGPWYRPACHDKQLSRKVPSIGGTGGVM